MLKITFMPKRKTPTSIQPVSYLVGQYNNELAVQIATSVFVTEHKKQYYDKVVISEPRILR